MRLKGGLFLSNMGDEYVVAAESPNVFRGIVKLNKSGAFVFELMQKDASDIEIVDKICEKYDVERSTACEDYKRFVRIFVDAGLME